MKLSSKKIILTIVLAVLLVIAFGWIVMMQNHALLVRSQAGDETLKLEEVTQTLEDIQSSWDTMERRIKEHYKVDATLSALALRSIIRENGDETIAMYTNGAVIKVENNEITAPEGIDRNLGLTADMFEAKQGLLTPPDHPGTLLVYSRISQPFYYVEWFDYAGIQEEIEEAADIPGILQKAEAAYDVYAFCAAEDPSADNGRRVLYSNGIFADLDDIFAETGTEEVSVEKTNDGTPYETGTLSLQNESFHYIKCPVPQISGYLVLLSLQPNLYIKALSQSSYMFATLIVILAMLLTSGFSLYYFIRENDLTPAMEKRYAPSHVRRFTALCGVIGGICIFLSGMLIYALNGLYDDTAKGKERLRMLNESLEMYADRYEQNVSRFKDIYLNYGTHIAEVLDNYPELREKSVLDTLASSISASTITLYDAEGNETVSSGAYIDMALGRDPESTTYDFRRILRGVPYIVHDLETDEITGNDEIRIGIRIQDASDESRYNAMIISIDPQIWSTGLLDMEQTVLQNLSGLDTTLCIADPETGIILVSSDASQAEKTISVLGLNESHLRPSLIKHVDMDTGSFFITSADLDTYGLRDGAQTSANMIAYYVGTIGSSSIDMLISSLTGLLLFIAVYAVLAWLVLSSYTDDYFEENKKTSRTSEKARKGWAGIRHSLSSIRPERKGLIIMELIIGLYLTQQIPIANFKTKLSRNSVYYYITSGSWEKGLNLFALASILLLLGQIILVVILIRLLLAAISTFVGSKGKTICRLIRSLTLYIALFTFLVLACTYIGISMAAIIAAVGTLGIAVSLGAQHFVSDIIAGLTIVFEGTFHVGDVVDIASFSGLHHGEIMEIGLRSTRLQTRHGNIVTLSNRDISLVSNMTQLNSRYECNITMSSEYPIDKIEAMLQTELPKIGEKDRRILAGPVYNGITALGMGTMTLSFMTECSEEDLPYVQQLINRSLHRIFTENGYKI